jgi:hypothetical protein
MESRRNIVVSYIRAGLLTNPQVCVSPYLMRLSNILILLLSSRRFFENKPDYCFEEAAETVWTLIHRETIPAKATCKFPDLPTLALDRFRDMLRYYTKKLVAMGIITAEEHSRYESIETTQFFICKTAMAATLTPEEQLEDSLRSLAKLSQVLSEDTSSNSNSNSNSNSIIIKKRKRNKYDLIAELEIFTVHDLPEKRVRRRILK